MRDVRQKQISAESDRGFSLIEVLISIALTVMVMGAVFTLLSRGQQSFEREPEVADLQQSARTALDLVTKDILQGGAGLPPNFQRSRESTGPGTPLRPTYSRSSGRSSPPATSSWSPRKWPAWTQSLAL